MRSPDRSGANEALAENQPGDDPLTGARFVRVLLTSVEKRHGACRYRCRILAEGGEAITQPCRFRHVVETDQCDVFRYREAEFLADHVHRAECQEVVGAEDRIGPLTFGKQAASRDDAAVIVGIATMSDADLKARCVGSGNERIFAFGNTGRGGMRADNRKPPAAGRNEGVSRIFRSLGIAGQDTVGIRLGPADDDERLAVTLGKFKEACRW